MKTARQSPNNTKTKQAGKNEGSKQEGIHLCYVARNENKMQIGYTIDGIPFLSEYKFENNVYLYENTLNHLTLMELNKLDVVKNLPQIHEVRLKLLMLEEKKYLIFS